MAGKILPSMTPAGPSGKVVGLLGGIGSGKSLVARMLQDLGCAVIDADALGHELLNRPAIVDALVERFGGGIIAADGAVIRSALAELAFADAESLSALNAIMHRPLREWIVERIEQVRRDRGGEGVIVLDAALLLETDWHKLCDTLVYVDCDQENRRRRVTAARGWSAGELARREKLQKSLDKKRESSDHVIGNNSSVSHLRQQVRLFYLQLVEPG